MYFVVKMAKFDGFSQICTYNFATIFVILPRILRFCQDGQLYSAKILLFENEMRNLHYKIKELRQKGRTQTLFIY